MNWHTYSYLNTGIHRPLTWKMRQDTSTCFWNDMITPSWSFWTTHYPHCYSSTSSKYSRPSAVLIPFSPSVTPQHYRIWIFLFSRLSRLERRKPQSFRAHFALLISPLSLLHRPFSNHNLSTHCPPLVCRSCHSLQRKFLRIIWNLILEWRCLSGFSYKGNKPPQLDFTLWSFLKQLLVGFA